MADVAANHDEQELCLPSIPHALAAIIQAASNADTPIPELGQLISSDPAFATQVLRLANSPWYGRGGQVNSVSRACSVMGKRSLRNMALCAATQNCVDPKQLGDFKLSAYWEQSVRRAAAGQLLAKRTGWVDPTDAFTVGLMQDIAVLSLVMSYPDKASEWMKHIGDSSSGRREAERKIFGRAHDEVAAQLGEAWGLPDDLMEALANHHDPGFACATESVKIAAAAELFADVLGATDKQAALSAVKAIAPDLLGEHETVEELIDELAAQVEDTARMLGISVSTQPSMDQILQQINKSLSQMNVSYEDLVQKLETTLAEKEALTRELESRNRELEQLSITDTLTGLPNRRAFSGRIIYEIQRASRSEGSMCVLVGDIDHFKKCNDTHGHAFGDDVLKAVAVALGSALRQCDMVARIGGEEFAIILPETDLPGSLVAAEKVLKKVSSCPLTTPEGEPYQVTISLGAAELRGPQRSRFNPDFVASQIVGAADAALYASKEGGRNRVSKHDKPIPWNPPVDGKRSAA